MRFKALLHGAEKNIVVIVDDLTAVAEVAATLTGDAPLVAAIAAFDRYAKIAIQKFEDASSVTITAENIAELAYDVPLDAPGSAPGGELGPPSTPTTTEVATAAPLSEGEQQEQPQTTTEG